MRYPKLRELKEAIRALAKGPYTSRFPYRKHQPYKSFRGRPKFQQEDCIGCTACVNVCPSGALSLSDHKENARARRILTYRVDLCIFCGQCQANCPTEKGIVLTQEFDLATTENRQELKQTIEKELLLCACCQEPIVPYEQVLWVAERLGALLFSNPSVMLVYLGSLGLALQEAVPAEKAGDLLRPDRIRVLCPRCRREAVLKS
jgi:hydrogenase-4 component H